MFLYASVSPFSLKRAKSSKTISSSCSPQQPQLSLNKQINQLIEINLSQLSYHFIEGITFTDGISNQLFAITISNKSHKKYE